MRQWMRENKGVLLGIAAAVLLLGWLATPAIRSLVRQRPGTEGTIHGKKIDARELQRAARAVRALQPLAPGAGQVGPLVYRMIRQGQEVEREDTWRYLVLLYEARKAGINVTPQEVKNALASNPTLSGQNGFNTNRYRMLLRRLNMDDQQLRNILADFLKITRLVSFKLDSIPAPENEVWMDYAYRNRQARVRFVELEPSRFTSLVEVSEKELQDFYEKHKNTVANPGSSKVGYKAPKRAKVACAVADYAKFEENVEVSDKDIRDYYEENKSEFLVEENEEDDGNSDAVAEQAGEAAKDSEGSDGDGGQNGQDGSGEADRDASEEDKENDGEDTDEDEEKQEKKEKEYRSLAEVRDQIKQDLISQKAQEAGREAASAVLEDLQQVSGRYVNKPLPLRQMARKHDVTYQVLQNDNGRAYLSQQEISRLLPGSGDIAAFAMDESTYSPEKFEGKEAARVCQVLDRREPHVLPFEKVKERVKQDYRRSRALEKAQEFGEKIVAKTKETSLAEAVKSLRANLPTIENESAGENQDEQNSGSSEEKEQEKEGPLQVQESSYFRRGAPVVPEMGGPRPEIVNKAFELKKDELATVVDGQDQKNCYVIQKMDEKAAKAASYYRMKPMLSGWRRWLGMLSSPRARRFAGRLLQQNYVLRRKITALRGWINDLEQKAELGTSPEKSKERKKERSKG